MALPVLVVGGIPVLANALELTKLFPNILYASDMTSLKNLVVGSDLRGKRSTDVIFILSDTLSDQEQDFPVTEFIRRVVGAGYKVLVVSSGLKGAEIHRNYPQVSLLNLPLRINDILFCISNFGFALSPVSNGGDILDIPSVEPLFSKPSTIPSGPQSPVVTTSGWQSPVANEVPIQEIPQQTHISPANVPFSTPVNKAQTNRKSEWENQVVSQDRIQSPVQSQNNGASFSSGTNWSNGSSEKPRSLSDFAQQKGKNWNDGPAQKGTASQETEPVNAWGTSPVSRVGTQQPNALSSSSRRRGMVITTAVSKGGTGKSTLTLNLAAYLGSRFKNANPSRTVCIIDANFQQADTGKYLGQYTPNIVNLIKDPSLMTTDRILSSLINRSDMNFSALLGPATPDDALALLTAESGRGGTSFSARFYSEVLDLLKPHFDYIFIDTPVAEKYHSLFSEFALPRADFVVVPVIPSKQTVHNTYMWLNSAVIAPRHAQGAGLRAEQIGIVLNRAEEGVGYGELEVMEELRKFNYLGSVPETIDWKRANNDGELIASKNKSDINSAFAHILGQITGEPLLLHGITPELKDERDSFSDRLRGLFRGKS